MCNEAQHYDTVIVGGGQAGLSTGYYLKQQGRDFVILDGSERIGDSWRNRWDSLRLFSPARYNGLPGMPFPAPAHTFPSKDEMADYLVSYANRFELPVRNGTRVERLSKQGGRFVLSAGDQQYQADNVVVAMANYQKPRVPSFAQQLDPNIYQIHSSEYVNPSQLQDGDVLIVGAGNSGVEIALDVVGSHSTWISGDYPGYIPFRIETFAARHFLVPFVLRVLFHRVMTIDTPVGRKVRPKLIAGAGPLVRTKPTDIAAAGIEQVPRVTGLRDGCPMLADDRALNVANVIWCTGFQTGFMSWIDLPIFDGTGKPMHERGVVTGEPGLYFVGLHFLYAISSAQLGGVGRDAAYIADQIGVHSSVSAPDALLA